MNKKLKQTIKLLSDKQYDMKQTTKTMKLKTREMNKSCQKTNKKIMKNQTTESNDGLVFLKTLLPCNLYLVDFIVISGHQKLEWHQFCIKCYLYKTTNFV